MDYEYEGSWEGDDEDVPYVELELDITDVHTLYRAVCSAIDVSLEFVSLIIYFFIFP